jgi:magnesium-protoporphyrin O-methyltransferase
MSCTCSTSALGDVFGERTARLEARRFRRSGLPRRAHALIDALRAAYPFHGATLLEGGAGVGGLSIELLRRGVERAVAIDAVPAAVRIARTLAEEYDVASRFEARIADFATLPDDDTYDIVVLDRVVCCYPDWHALLTSAADRARAAIALTYPPARWWSRLFVRCANAGMRITRRQFRVHVHPPERMHAFLASRGFTVAGIRQVGAWEVCVLRAH